jgi:hypothetical protein
MRLFMAVTVVVLVVGAPSSRPGHADPSRVQTPDRGEGWILNLPQPEGLLSSLPRLSINEFQRAIERSRPLPNSAAPATLILLGIGVLSWRFPPRRAGHQPPCFARRRVAGPRAPPLQLV